MFEKILRVMSTVKRWSIVPTVHSQNNAEHSFYVAHYANDMAILFGFPKEMCLSAVRLALWHDVGEIYSGDFPGPHKRFYMDMRAAQNNEEKLMQSNFSCLQERRGDLECASGDKAAVKLVVKLADMLDAAVQMWEEYRIYGNKEAYDHYVVLFKAFSNKLVEMQMHGYQTSLVESHARSMFTESTYSNSRITY